MKNNQTRPKVLDLYAHGFGGPAIAKILNLHVGTIYYYLKDVEKPNGGYNAKSNKDEVVKMYEQDKLSCNQIAEKIGLDSGTVWNRLKNAGVKFRTKSEGMQLRGLRKIGPDKEVVDLYKTGISQIKVAEKYNVTISSVADVLNRNNVNEGNYGPRNPAWKGGRSELGTIIRDCETYKHFREQVMRERNFTCQLSLVRGGELHIHHIVPFATLLEDFIEKFNPNTEDRANLYKQIDQFQTFWDKSNILLVSDPVHHQIHSNKVDFNIKDIKDLLSIKSITRSQANLLLKNGHYLGTAPNGTEYYYGLFLGESLIGCATFGRGANKHLSSGVKKDALELTRLYLVSWSNGKNLGSFFLSRATSLLKLDRPGIECVVAYSDPSVGHSGGIYKACNWKSLGQCHKDYKYKLSDGTIAHKSKFRCKNGKTEKELTMEAGATKIPVEGKLKFIYNFC